MISLGHHWAVSMRGGEKVLEHLLKMFPDAEIYTLVTNSEKLSPPLREATIHTSLLQKFPAGKSCYRWFLFLFPFFFQQMKVAQATSIFLCSDASFAKAIRTPPQTLKICYCHSPPRYLWGLHNQYTKECHFVKALVLKLGLSLFGRLLRSFDFKKAQEVDQFISNSKFVAKRIKACYDRDSFVIHPPVEVDRFNHDRQRDDFYLVVSQLEPYKRIGLVIEAFRHLDEELIVVGEGVELDRLTAQAPENVTITGRLPDDQVTDMMERTKALIFPGIEDFGITPLEANAAGAPVIAFAEGGVLETIIPEETGLFFPEQTSASIVEAIRKFQTLSFSSDNCRKNAERFRPEQFSARLTNLLDTKPWDPPKDPN